MSESRPNSRYGDDVYGHSTTAKEFGCMLMKNVSGTAWFDDVKLERLP